MLQNESMQPHKPAPNPRKIEVDLSEILIQPQAVERPDSGDQAPFQNPFPLPWKDPVLNAHFARVSSADWTNIIFAVGASLAAVICTLATFDDLENFRRLHLASDEMYSRPIYFQPRFHGPRSRHFARTGSTFGVNARAKKADNSASERTGSSNQILGLSKLLPAESFLNSSLLPNAGQISQQGPSGGPTTGPTTGPSTGPMHSTGHGDVRGDMKGSGKIKQTNRATQMPATSALASPKMGTSSTRLAQGQGSKLKNGGGNGRPTAANQISSGAKPLGHSMHSVGNGGRTMQGMGTPNCMHMEHGLLGQAPAITALQGLNKAGLGGGGGHRGANARR